MIMARYELCSSSVSFLSVAPRGNVQRLTARKVDPEVAARAARMEAAHLVSYLLRSFWVILTLNLEWE